MTDHLAEGRRYNQSELAVSSPSAGTLVRLCGKIWQRVFFEEIGNHRAVGHLGEQGSLDKLPRGRRAMTFFGVGTAGPPRAY